jgi:hypothetical protein
MSTWNPGYELRGRVNAGKGGKGDIPESVTLTLPGRMVYELQQHLEGLAARGGNYPDIRWAVLRAEDLREAVEESNEQKRLH